jgi:hypothetical protein
VLRKDIYIHTRIQVYPEKKQIINKISFERNMNTQFFKKIGFKTSLASGTKNKKTPNTVKASSKIKQKHNKTKFITYKDAVIALREKLKKYKKKVEQEQRINKELARRVVEYKSKYEQEKKALEIMTSDCATWRKFAMTLQVHPNNKANRSHNIQKKNASMNEKYDENNDINQIIKQNKSNTPTNTNFNEVSKNRSEIDAEIDEFESTFHTIWDKPVLSKRTIKNNGSTLFDSFFICGTPVLEAFEAFDAAPGLKSKHTLSKCRTTIEPKILYGYGMADECSLPTAIESFCFPSGIKPKILKLTSSASNLSHVMFGNGSEHDEGRLVNTHTFKLLGTVDDNPDIPLYGYCIKVDRVLERPSIRTTGPECVQAPVCYCFLSKKPFHSLFFNVLKQLVEFDRLVNADHWSSIRSGAHENMSKEHTHGHGRPSKNTVELLQKMYVAPLPSLSKAYVHNITLESSGTTISLKYDRTVYKMQKKKLQSEDDHAMTRWSGPVLLSSLTVDRFVLLLGYALLEHKIIFQSSSEYTSSSCVLAFESLLRPFRWTGPVIPILPKSALQCVEAPVPILAGITSATRKYLNNRDDIIVVRVDEGSLVLPTETDENDSSFHLYRVPDCDRLCYNLTEALETVYQEENLDNRDFDIDVSKGEVTPSNLRIKAMEKFSEVLHEYLYSLVEQCKLNKLNRFSHEHPSGIFLNKFQQTQIMSHFAQLHSEGDLLDDNDTDDDDDDIYTALQNYSKTSNNENNNDGQYSNKIVDDEEEVRDKDEEKLFKMYNDDQDLSTDEDETFPEVVEEMYNENHNSLNASRRNVKSQSTYNNNAIENDQNDSHVSNIAANTSMPGSNGKKMLASPARRAKKAAIWRTDLQDSEEEEGLYDDYANYDEDDDGGEEGQYKDDGMMYDIDEDYEDDTPRVLRNSSDIARRLWSA